MGGVQPVDNTTARTAIDISARLASDLFSADRITNPESQNTGIEVM